MSTSLAAHWDSFEDMVHSLMAFLRFHAAGKHHVSGFLLQARYRVALCTPILCCLLITFAAHVPHI